MTNLNIAVATWVVFHAPDRSPSPFAACRCKDGATYGYALDGMTYELVRQQLPLGGIRRARMDSDHPTIVEFWDYRDAQQKTLEGILYTRDHPFVPVVGQLYDLHYGHVTIGSQSGFAMAKIRADGLESSRWIDLDTGKPLAPAFRALAVQAYKPL